MDNNPKGTDSNPLCKVTVNNNPCKGMANSLKCKVMGSLKLMDSPSNSNSSNNNSPTVGMASSPSPVRTTTTKVTVVTTNLLNNEQVKSQSSAFLYKTRLYLFYIKHYL